MKKIFLGILIGISLFFTIGCSKEKVIDNGNPSEPNNPSEPEIIEDEFKIKLEDNGLKALENEYVFSTLDDQNSDFFYDAIIAFEVNNDWKNCTSISEPIIEIEDEAILPKEAITFNLITNSDIVGSSGSNEIARLDFKINRSLLKVGETKFKFTTKPQNGSSTIYKETTLCVKVIIKEYGSIVVDSCKASFKLDIENIEELLEKNVINNLKSIEFAINDYKNEGIYGSNVMLRFVDNLSLDKSQYEYDDLILAANLNYKAYVFITYYDEISMRDKYMNLNVEFINYDNSTIKLDNENSSFMILKDSKEKIDLKLAQNN